MLTLRKLACLLWLLALLGACSTMPTAPTQQSFAAYPYHYKGFDFKVAWKTTPTTQGAAVDGVIQNVRYPRVDNLEVTVSLLNPAGTIVGKTTTFPIPLPLNMDDYRNFDLMLENVTLSRGDLLHFSIRYRVLDDPKSTFTWLTNFTVDAMTGALIAAPQE